MEKNLWIEGGYHVTWRKFKISDDGATTWSNNSRQDSSKKRTCFFQRNLETL